MEKAIEENNKALVPEAFNAAFNTCDDSSCERYWSLGYSSTELNEFKKINKNKFMKTIIKSLSVFIATLFMLPGYAQHLSELSTKENNKLKAKKVLFVVTSQAIVEATGHQTGLWIEEFVTPYYLLLDKGVRITVASPKGGVSPIDPRSQNPDYSNEETKRFNKDSKAQAVLNNTVALKDINFKEYDAVFYPGGHGPMWDMPDNKYSIKLIENMYNAGKPIAFVCHAPVALKNVKTKDGNLLIKGKKVAGFANTEEHAGHTEVDVPFLLEDMLTNAGADYVKGPDWGSFAVTDGLLISGQNPHSSEAVTERIVAALLAAKK